MASVLKVYGDGYGYGYGDGYGYGYGDGYGYGAGYGYGYGEQVGSVGDLDVRYNGVFGVVTVGCKVLTISEWKTQWRQLAMEHELEVSDAEVAAIFQACEAPQKA